MKIHPLLKLQSWRRLEGESMRAGSEMTSSSSYKNTSTLIKVPYINKLSLIGKFYFIFELYLRQIILDHTFKEILKLSTPPVVEKTILTAWSSPRFYPSWWSQNLRSFTHTKHLFTFLFVLPIQLASTSFSKHSISLYFPGWLINQSLLASLFSCEKSFFLSHLSHISLSPFHLLLLDGRRENETLIIITVWKLLYTLVNT